MTRFAKLYSALRTVSLMQLFWSISGGAVAMWALAKYTVPYFGWDTSVYQQGAAAGFGALLGAVQVITGFYFAYDDTIGIADQPGRKPWPFK